MDGNQEFKALLQESRVLATDMIAKTVRRLLSTESALAQG
jgi:CRP-like cAMP-binding protein